MPASSVAENPGPDTHAGSDRDLSIAQGLDAKPPACLSQVALVEATELKSGSNKQETSSACSDDRCAFSYHTCTVLGIAH